MKMKVLSLAKFKKREKPHRSARFIRYPSELPVSEEAVRLIMVKQQIILGADLRSRNTPISEKKS